MCSLEFARRISGDPPPECAPSRPTASSRTGTDKSSVHTCGAELQAMGFRFEWRSVTTGGNGSRRLAGDVAHASSRVRSLGQANGDTARSEGKLMWQPTRFTPRWLQVNLYTTTCGGEESGRRPGEHTTTTRQQQRQQQQQLRNVARTTTTAERPSRSAPSNATSSRCTARLFHDS